jgi:hypothetical protein
MVEQKKTWKAKNLTRKNFEKLIDKIKKDFKFEKRNCWKANKITHAVIKMIESLEI